MVDRYLTIYLQDHLAMSLGGAKLCRRVLAANEHNPLGQQLSEICVEIEAQHQLLERTLRRLHISPSPLKNAGMWLAEKAGRLKLNGEVLRYSPLSRVTEIEVLMAAAQVRGALWETLADAKLLYPELEEIPASEMARQAFEQRDRLQELHQQAARAMLKSGRRAQEDDEERHEQSSPPSEPPEYRGL